MRERIKPILVRVTIVFLIFLISDVGYTLYQKSKYDYRKQWYLKTGRDSYIEDRLKSIQSRYNKVTVALIDTGVDYSHEILKKHIWKNEDEIVNNGIDDDNNGYIDDVVGWNFVNNNNNILSGEESYENDHGTECASIISSGDCFSSFKGINCDNYVKVMCLKVLKGIENEGEIKDVVKAIDYAEKNGADICNLSLNYYKYSSKLAKVIKKSKMLFIASAGNDGINIDIDDVYLPSLKYENIISVAGIDKEKKLLKNSNYGKCTVDLAAPGKDIYCAVTDGYDYDTGTSLSTAIVSGIVAKIMSKYNLKGHDRIKKAIMGGVVRNRELKSKTLSGGYLNITKVLECAEKLGEE